VAIRATDSGRSDRPDLRNVDIVGNKLNGETIVGREKPDTLVDRLLRIIHEVRETLMLPGLFSFTAAY
jgi:hypothetical protein